MAKQVKEENVTQEDCNRQSKFTVPKFGSLKEILVELHKLKEWDFKQSVFNHLKSGLETYLNAFYGDRGYSSYGGYIQAFTSAGEKVSKEILQNPSWASRWEDPHSKHSGKDCGEKYSNALQACLPKTFAALFFLFFNVSNDCRNFGGGSWNSYNVNGSGDSLGQWLIAGSDDFIDRGFLHEDLHTSNNGQKVAGELKKAVSLKPSSTEGSLQKVLCGLMFVCTWEDALTGHAICFLYEFCEKVMVDREGTTLRQKFTEACPGGNFKKLQAICRELQTHLQPFTDSYGDSGLRAICKENQELFEEIWKEDSFGEYCKWLKVNLDDIIKALNEMSSNSSPWSADSLRVASSAGTFKYGFVFTRKWDGESESLRDKVKGYISALINGDKGSLEDLKKCLNGDSSANSEAITQEPTGTSGAAAAGAAGGILSLGGAGFGAAYGFNLFGLKDIMSGVFGAIRGLVVGF